MPSTKRKMLDDAAEGDVSNGEAASLTLAGTSPARPISRYPGVGIDPGSTSRKTDVYYRDLYSSEPNFRILARQDTAFAAVYV